MQLYFHRNCQGRNDNPNVIEFKSAFCKLLVCHPIITSVGHNVINNATGILTASSAYLKPMSSQTATQSQAQEIELNIDYNEIMLKEIDGMDAYEQHMSAYLALCIEEKLMQKINQKKYKCCGCADVLRATNEKITDELLAQKTTALEETKQPSFSTLKIVVFANGIMRIISSLDGHGSHFDTVWKTIFSNIDVNDLYTSQDFETHGQNDSLTFQFTHKEEFVIQMVKLYLILKSQKIGRKITEEGQGELIRHKNKDAIHKAGQ